MKSSLAFVAILLLSAFVDIRAATLVVTKTADTIDGVCDADCSLREAVAAADAGDTIGFSAIFDSPQTITLIGGQISITKKLTIIGPGSNLLTVSGNNASRILHISGGPDVLLSGMALKNGSVTTIDENRGGAIYLSTLTLTKMILSGNTARYVVSPMPIVVQGEGGGIYSSGSSLSLVDTEVSRNAAPTASGIYCSGGPLSLTGSAVNNNGEGAIYGHGATSISIVSSTVNGNWSTAMFPQEERVGGAIVGPTNGPIFVIDSQIAGNSDYGLGGGSPMTIVGSIISGNCCIGGGIGSGGTTTITRTTISGNIAALSNGGGIRNTGTMTLNDSTISDNRTFTQGGGIYNTGRLSLTNSTISGNRADAGDGHQGPGGGISTVGSTSVLNLTNSTITNNFAGGHGGGIWQTESSTVNIRNTILAGNRSNSHGNDFTGMVVSQGSNLIGNTVGSFGWITADVLNRNAGLGPLADNGGPTQTHALMPTSQAVNAGNNSLAIDPATNMPLTADQRGVARFIGVVDIGAFESIFTVSYVAFGGRVSAPGGRGISNARITLTDSDGTVFYAHSNPFGYFRFAGISPGSYIVSPTHKRYLFGTPQIITISANMPDMSFVANNVTFGPFSPTIHAANNEPRTTN